MFREHLDVGWSVLEVTYCRAKLLLDSETFRSSSRNVPRIPLTAEEVKEDVRIKYSIDEADAVKMLQSQDSTAAEVIIQLGLTREIIRQALAKLEQNRPQQVVLCSIVCTTRFKYFEAGKLLKTTCLACGLEDSFTHLVQCTGMRMPSLSMDPENVINFLVELSGRALKINAGLPRPRRFGDDQEEVAVEPELAVEEDQNNTVTVPLGANAAAES